MNYIKFKFFIGTDNQKYYANERKKIIAKGVQLRIETPFKLYVADSQAFINMADLINKSAGNTMHSIKKNKALGPPYLTTSQNLAIHEASGATTLQKALNGISEDLRPMVYTLKDFVNERKYEKINYVCVLHEPLLSAFFHSLLLSEGPRGERWVEMLLNKPDFKTFEGGELFFNEYGEMISLKIDSSSTTEAYLFDRIGANKIINYEICC